MRTVVRVSQDPGQVLPEGMSFEDGVTVPLVGMAAWQSLVEVAHLQKGESVLIHTAAGGEMVIGVLNSLELLVINIQVLVTS